MSLRLKDTILANSSTSSKWLTSRTISLTGSVTGSGGIDGSGNLSITTSTNHSHSTVGTSTIGNSVQPVYLNAGKPTACTMSASGNRWGVLTSIGGDGVLEVGKYIDFHLTNAATTDHDGRFTLNSANDITWSGTMRATTFAGNLSGSADKVDGWNIGGESTASSAIDADKGFILNAESLSDSNFYPVTFSPSDKELRCFIQSNNRSGSHAWNQNLIRFIMTAQGWSDCPKTLTILNYGVYSSGEITIGCIGYGNEGGVICVWVRGGSTYRIISNRTPTLRTSNYTNGNEIFTVGTSTSGGTNTKVTIAFTPQNTITNGAYISQNLKVAGTIYGNVNYNGTLLSTVISDVANLKSELNGVNSALTSLEAAVK